MKTLVGATTRSRTTVQLHRGWFHTSSTQTIAETAMSGPWRHTTSSPRTWACLGFSSSLTHSRGSPLCACTIRSTRCECFACSIICRITCTETAIFFLLLPMRDGSLVAQVFVILTFKSSAE